MKAKTQNYQSLDITLTKEDVEKTDLDADKVEKEFKSTLIHIIRVPVEKYSDYNNSQIKTLLQPHLQNKSKVVYYIETLDINQKPKQQCFTPVYF